MFPFCPKADRVLTRVGVHRETLILLNFILNLIWTLKISCHIYFTCTVHLSFSLLNIMDQFHRKYLQAAAALMLV
uniref:Uncharacterized protein n=1 Tax=Aegilops tauschii subsp. strangulata TaxID=200361 RepID=A0A453FEG2_AEGTS